MQHQIIMIDDNPLDHLIVSRICDSEGTFGDMAHLQTAQELVEFLAVNEHDIARLPDIILLDLNMPNLSGWDVLEKLKYYYQHKGKPLDVYILSSSVSPVDQKRSQQYAFVKDFFIKPMTRQKIRDLYNLYLH